MKKTYSNKQIHFINMARSRKRQQTETAKDTATVGEPKVSKLNHPNSDDNIVDDTSPDRTPTRSNSSDINENNNENLDTNENMPNSGDAMDIPDDSSINGAGSAGGTAQRNVRNTSSSGGGTAAGTTGGMRGTVPLYVGIRSTPMRTTRTYTKQYHLRLQNELVETKVYNVGNDLSFNGIRFPFHDIPVHVLGFYLSQTEIQELMQYTKAVVKGVHVGVENKTAVLNFETASSVSTIGNNNVGVYLCEISPDIQVKRCGLLPDQKVLIEERFWGLPYINANVNEWSNDNAFLGAQYVRRTLSNKFEYYTPKTSPNFGQLNFLETELPCFDVYPFVSKRINASMNEGLLTEYHYKPKNGLVAAQCWFGAGDCFTSNTFENIGMTNYKQKTQSDSFYTLPTENSPGGWIEPQIWEGHSPNTFGPNMLEYALARWRNYTKDTWSIIPIENSAISGSPIIKQDPLIIGIDPLVTEISTSTNNKWEAVKCFVDICLNVTCEIEITQGVDYMNANTRTILRPNYMNPTRVPQVVLSANNMPQMMDNPSVVTADSRSKNFLPQQKETSTNIARQMNITRGPMKVISKNLSNLRRSERLQANNIIKNLMQQHQGPLDVEVMQQQQQQQKLSANSIPKVYQYLKSRSDVEPENIDNSNAKEGDKASIIKRKRHHNN